MLDSKVIRLIQALLSKELITVERYLCAPYVSSNDECARLFVQICKFLPDMDSPKLTKERLFAKLFGKRPYNDGKMRKLMTQLTQLIEQYLMERELKNSEELRTKLLAMALSERNSYKLFSDVVQSRLKVLDDGINKGRDYFRESFELSDMLYFHPGSAKLIKKEEFWQRSVDDLESYFTLVRLQSEANRVVSSRVISAGGLSSGYMDIVLQFSGSPQFANQKAIQLFRHLVVLLQNKSEEDIETLRKNAIDTFPQLSKFEQDFATNLLRNYAVPFSNQGSMVHSRFVFELYKLELEQSHTLIPLSAGAFMNIASLGLMVDEIEWTQYFIDNFELSLPEGDRINTINFCTGFLHYHKGLKNNDMEEFYNAIRFFNLIPTKAGLNYEMRVSPALLRVHFELLERGKETLDGLLNQVRNFERHLRGNDQYSNAMQHGFMNFLRYYKLLARLVSSPQIKESSVTLFQKKLNQAEPSPFFKTWLQKKAKGLVKN
jgi:hypothetical protein